MPTTTVHPSTAPADHPASTPLSKAIASSSLMADRRPIPLVATAYDIDIFGGLADVVVRRTFRNVEAESIEAALTLPVPVHAVLHGLEARIGGRVLKSVAKGRVDARSTYENAIDTGRTAVLHEELIRGIHLISVGHVGPGMEVEVTVHMALALACIDGRITLRLPTTVGDVYGSSGLADADELLHGGPATTAPVTIRCDSGQVLLQRKTVAAGATVEVPLNAPIVAEVVGWTPRALSGRTADGRQVALSITPVRAGHGTIDCAVLFDRSGSMAELCGSGSGLSKHAAALLGLSEAADDLVAGDQLGLWQFESSVEALGRADPGSWRELIRRIGPPTNGTELGSALDAVMSQSDARDILLITDGKSFALDVHALAARGRRITVVLIGEDSLEANVGHLAVLTGGDIFVPDSATVTGAVREALRAIRQSGDADARCVRRCGMAIEATWAGAGEIGALPANERPARTAGAYAASLLLATSSKAEAVALAEREGLVTHLTSLVLVDEAGALQSGLPAFRKVALPSPATVCAASYGPLPSAACAPTVAFEVERRRHDTAPRVVDSMVSRMRSLAGVRKRASDLGRSGGAPKDPSVRPAAAAPPSKREAERDRLDLSGVATRIDWAQHGTALAAGDLSSLDPEIAGLLRSASQLPSLRKAARRFGIDPLVIVVALLARVAAAKDRHADRVARLVLGALKPRQLMAAADRLGL